MSLTVTRTIAELDRQCSALGVMPVPNAKGKVGKTEYILALRKYYIEQKYGEDVPKPLDLVLNIEAPMLCSRYTELKPEQQEEIWNSNEWFLQEKLDGVRMMLVYADGQWDFYSRNISVDDFLPVSYKGHILENWHPDIDAEFILDCELTSVDQQVSTVMAKRGCVTECQLQAVTALISLNSEETLAIQKDLLTKEGRPVLKFNAFDCLYYNGEWVIDKPLWKRDEIVRELIGKLSALGMSIDYPLSNISNKKQFYKTIISLGKEGCVAKNINSTYQTSNNRAKNGFVKIKRTMSESAQMLGLGDTIDAFITGFEEADPTKQNAGLVGSLVFSVILQKEDGTETVHTIAKIAGIPDKERREMTEIIDGKPQLKQEYYNKVVEIDGQCISARERRLRHARIIHWRPDKSVDGCIMTENFLNSMIL